LLEFPGNTFVISHDRWFLDRIATHILAFEGNSHVEFFQGNYREYEEDKKRRLGDDAGPKRLRFKALKEWPSSRPSHSAGGPRTPWSAWAWTPSRRSSPPASPTTATRSSASAATSSMPPPGSPAPSSRRSRTLPPSAPRARLSGWSRISTRRTRASR